MNNHFADPHPSRKVLLLMDKSGHGTWRIFQSTLINLQYPDVFKPSASVLIVSVIIHATACLQILILRFSL